jgi:hypothetical protein
VNVPTTLLGLLESEPSHGYDTTATDSLPMLGLLVITDAAGGAMETVRTAIESAATDDAPTLPWTFGELKGQNNRQVDRFRGTRRSGGSYGRNASPSNRAGDHVSNRNRG